MAQEQLPEFRLCRCGLHGRIVCADGRPFEVEVYTTSMARKAVAAAIERRRLEPRHAERLNRVIADCGLPTSYDAVPRALMSAVSERNERAPKAEWSAEMACLTEAPS